MASYTAFCSHGHLFNHSGNQEIYPKMKKQIFVIRNNISKNKRNRNKNVPVIEIREGKSSIQCNELTIVDDDNNEVAKIVYQPNDPLPGGSVVWIETEYDVDVK